MKRRALLATAASLAVAGCTGGEQPGYRTDTTRTTSTMSTSDTTTTTTTTGVPEELKSLGAPASEVACPVGDDGRAVCYPEHEGTALSLTPSPETVSLPSDETTLTLANDSGYEYRANFYGWTLSKRVDGDWYRVAPQFYPDPLHVLPSGNSHEWTFSVDNSEQPTGGASSESDIDIAGLGGGEYAFTVGGWFRVGEQTVNVAAGTHLTLDGPELELTPAGDPDVSRDGSTVTVTATREPAENEEPSLLVVERIDREDVSESEIHDRIAEQLLRPRMSTMGDPNPLRNALPFFEDGVETVRYEAPSGVTPPFGLDEPYVVRYDGGIYRATASRRD
jgi:hypothetical protein